jgi:hypothetical protein
VIDLNFLEKKTTTQNNSRANILLWIGLHGTMPMTPFTSSPWPYRCVEEIISDKAFFTYVKAPDLDLGVKVQDHAFNLGDYMVMMDLMKLTS